MMQSARYTFGHEGQNHFLRPAIEIQGAVIEPFFENDGWQYDNDYFVRIPALYQSRRPTALGGFEIAGVVMCFIGTCFAKKIFDEIYERTLKRPIGAQLDKLLATVQIPPGKNVEYRDIIYFEDIDLVVVIRAIATKDCGADVQRHVMQAHRLAHEYIEQHGRKAPIHCHKIVNGHVAIEPELFNTLEEIKQHDRSVLKVSHR
ncbi:hypothetical protein [Paracidovorax avenae]|uniref:hypothetical protein n=1 Tax=Paracidovorax avenae TaxID=80867 RepID=UPI000D2020ED|nr:hypothetical protein [Paracidovorax avenae]AVT04640.1 hypothetical protein C8248_00595 [Paracidovorax avenae]